MKIAVEDLSQSPNAKSQATSDRESARASHGDELDLRGKRYEEAMRRI